jgi:hypothetical protein
VGFIASFTIIRSHFQKFTVKEQFKLGETKQMAHIILAHIIFPGKDVLVEGGVCCDVEIDADEAMKVYIEFRCSKLKRDHSVKLRPQIELTTHRALEHVRVNVNACYVIVVETVHALTY